MEQTLRQFEAALHASAEGLGGFVGAIEQSHARERFPDAVGEPLPPKAVEMSDVAQVFGGGEFDVDAGCLEDHPDLLAQLVRLFRGVEAHNHGSSAGGQHQRRQDAEHRSLTASVRAEKAKDLRRIDVEGNAVERLALAVGMAQVLDGNYRQLGGWAGCSLRCGIYRNAQNIFIYPAWKATLDYRRSERVVQGRSRVQK